MIQQFALHPYAAAVFVFFSTILALACLHWIHEKVAHPLAVDGFKKMKEKNPDEEFGVQHIILAWVTLGLVAAFFGAGIYQAFQPSTRSSASNAETLTKGYFGMQVIDCYQMTDMELLANETKCKDALRRVRGY